MNISEKIGFSQTLAVVAIMLLVLLRLFLMLLTDDVDLFYYIRHSIYTVAWFALAYFMFHCSMYMRMQAFVKEEIVYMKKIAFWAMLACVARVIVSAVHQLPIVTNEMWQLMHCVLELLVWTILAVFFGCYWRIRAEQENSMDM